MLLKDIRDVVATNGGDWVKKYGAAWETQVQQLKSEFGQAIEEVKMPPGDLTDVPIIYVTKERVIDLLKELKTKHGYQFLSDISASDESPAEKRFEVIYQLFSHTHFARIRVKVRLREGEEVPTLSSVWSGANWAEREVWDMFGIKFSGHPDLRRILMDLRWEGHPLRKDYPLRGYQVFPTPEPIDPGLLK
jgi:NADH-quinone oxidoreductase subunit C